MATGLMQPPAETEAEEPAEGEASNVTPEEQAQYTAFVDNGLKLLYAEGGFKASLERIQKAPEPVEGLAAVISTVVIRLQESAEQSGQKLDGDIMLHGGTELLQDFAETCGKAGVHEFTEDEIQAATYRALDLFREHEQQAGKLDQQSAQQDWEALKAADQSGELDRQVPGLKEKFAGVAEEEAVPPAPPSRGGLAQGRMA